MVLQKLIGHKISMKNGRVRVRGYSGYTNYRNGNLFIKETDGDAKRLLHQAHKQSKYRSRLLASPLASKFDVPRVVSTWNNGFSMEYIEGKNKI